MHVEVRKNEEVVIVDMTGRLVGGIGDEILRNVVNEVLAEDWKKILLNLSGVTAIDSAGIGELVASLKTASHLGESLRILNLNERVRTAGPSALVQGLNVESLRHGPADLVRRNRRDLAAGT